jgi:hypothetical protein
MPGNDKIDSFSAFASVDALASKPVLGSDGAASWQEFRQSKTSGFVSKGTAPHIPLKRADKLGTGFKSIDEERRNEKKVREEGNDAEMNSGYTTFKRKHDRAEIEERKRRKLIEERVRPDKVKYYIPAETFEGWKEDYIFTTRDRGTGYYWDGMDSLKKLKGIEDSTSTSGQSGNTNEVDSSKQSNSDSKKQKKKKKKKKDKKDANQSSQAIEEDTNNPMEQVLNAMRRRTEILTRPPGSSNQILMETRAALTGTISSSTVQNLEMANDNQNMATELAKYNWEIATDPSSGKVYYFSRKTGERQWDSPIEKLKKAANATTLDDVLPDGWRPALDAVGKTYYYHRESGKTSWEKPTNT